MSDTLTLTIPTTQAKDIAYGVKDIATDKDNRLKAGLAVGAALAALGGFALSKGSIKALTAYKPRSERAPIMDQLKALVPVGAALVPVGAALGGSLYAYNNRDELPKAAVGAAVAAGSIATTAYTGATGRSLIGANDAAKVTEFMKQSPLRRYTPAMTMAALTVPAIAAYSGTKSYELDKRRRIRSIIEDSRLTDPQKFALINEIENENTFDSEYAYLRHTPLAFPGRMLYNRDIPGAVGAIIN